MKQDQISNKQTNGATPPENQIESMSVASVVGEVCWLMSQSLSHRFNFFLADIEWLILPAISEGQYKLFRNEKAPAGVALWACVSDEVEKKLNAGLGKLTPKDWVSGKHLWLIDLIAPYGQANQMLEDLKNTVFKGKTFKYHQTQSDGTRKVIVCE